MKTDMDPFVASLQRALDAMTKRGALTASNIANIDTPGYRTRDVDFDRMLKEAIQADAPASGMRQTHGRHFTASASVISQRAEEVGGLTVRNDGNDVSLDREMAMLSQTRHRYEAATTFIRLQLRQIRAALTEGR